MDSALRLEALLEHADWVRRLAHSLVADPARADDVAQETWLAALQSPPQESKNVRAWLGTVVRNAARRSGRSQSRREHREASGAREEALPSAAELVEQADLQREIAGLVVALDEPYRQTILLRFYQGIAAEEIARRTGVPLNTVRTRLQRGIAQLRERLDRRFGSRESWCIALGPLLQTSLTTHAVVQGSSLSLGALIMAVKLKWVVAASAALLGLWWFLPPGEVLPASGELAKTADAPSQPTIEAPVSSESIENARVAQAASKPTKTQQPAPPRVTSVVSGRCVDLAGAPLAGLEIEWIDEREARVVGGFLQVGHQGIEATPELRARIQDDAKAALLYPDILNGARGVAEALRGETYRRPSVRTEIDGTFRIEQESSGGEIDLVNKDLLILETVHVAEFPEPLYVVAKCIQVSGVVVDSEQRPIVGARLTWFFSIKSATAFPYVPDGGGSTQGGAASDANGRFKFERLPLLIGGSSLIHVEKEGYDRSSLAAPEHAEPNLIVELKKKAEEVDRHVAGRVQHRNGPPAVGAGVDLGQDHATTDVSGNFRIRLTSSVLEDTPLTALKQGSRPTVLQDFGAQVIEHGYAIDDVLLVLDDPLPPIRGRVLDAEGSPCTNWRVSLVGATPHGTSNWTLEGAACGERPEQTTDAEGRFRFNGLLDHAYRVRAWNTKNMLAVESDQVFPGNEDVVVRVPADALLERVVGRVVSRRGMPIGGATISVGIVLFTIGGGYSAMWQETGKADAQGRFELHDFPRRGCLIGASDPRIHSNSLELDESMAARELLIEVDLDLRFRLDAPRAGEFDHFQLLDRAGAPLTVVMHLQHAETHINKVKVGPTGSPVCSTTEAAETMVLFLGETEVRRMPLTLRPGEINVLSGTR